MNEEKLIKDENGNESSEEKDSEKQNVHEKRCLRRQQQTPPPILLNSGNQSKELKKLQVYGAGPKMPGVLGLSSPTSEQSSPPKEASIKACLHCGESNSVPTLLTCDNCENTYHMMCLIPPLHDWPKGLLINFLQNIYLIRFLNRRLALSPLFSSTRSLASTTIYP